MSAGTGIYRLGEGCNNHSVVLENPDLNWGIALNPEENIVYASSEESVW